MSVTKSKHEKFFSAAKLVAAITMLSRILGLVRDMALVPLGSGELADRFWTAFSVPNLFRRLFGEGALAAAFIPVFTEINETEGLNRARVVFANVMGILSLILISLIILITLGLWGAWEIFGGDEYRLILLQLTAIMLPFMLTVCLLALGSAALNCKGHFAYPAFAPIILNVVLIAAAFVAPKVNTTDKGQFYTVAVAVVVAGVLQLIGVAVLLKRVGLSLMMNFRPVLPEVKKIGKLMGPMLIPISLLQFSAFADRMLALIFTADAANPSLPLEDGVVRCLYAANRLYQLPMGVMAVSIATAVFPLFSLYAARKDHEGLCDATNRALRLSLFLGIPSGVALLVMAGPVIELIFQRRNFTPYDTQRAAMMLQMYSVGMWAYFCNHILLRAFYSIKQPKKPLILACGLAVVNLGLVIGGIYTPLKGAAVGLATAVTSSINALILLWILHKMWGRIGLGNIITSLVKIAVAAAVMGAAIYGVQYFLQNNFSGTLGLLTTVVADTAVGLGSFFVAAKILKCKELPELLKRKQPPAEIIEG